MISPVRYAMLQLLNATTVGLLVVAAVDCVAPRRHHCAWDSPANVTVRKYAFEAFPSFAQASQGRLCPRSLHELTPWMSPGDTRDPWGTAYAMDCGSRRFVVTSAGEDRRFGTTDDIRSDE